MRIAGAPISWGVCEVPGWGFQLTPERVLSEMHAIGLQATEFGPLGWLPENAPERLRALRKQDLEPVGSFVPVLLHDSSHDPVPAIQNELENFHTAGGEVLILAAASGQEGYDDRPHLDENQWATLYTNLEKLTELAISQGIQPSLHPHVGTMVETRDDVERVLANTSVPLCLDTGHLLIGGTDPVHLVERYADRINHVHAKDVRLDLISRIRSGELTYTDAVREGVYVPLGDGDVDFRTIAGRLSAANFTGWWVLEQDTILTGEPADNEGPVRDVLRSLHFLRTLS